MSKSTPSSLLWAFLIIGVAGLVAVILAVAGVVSTGIISIIGTILLAVGIVGAGFIAVAPRSADALSSAKATATPVDASVAPAAPVATPAAPVATPAPSAPAVPASPAASASSSQSGFTSIQRTGSFSSPEAAELDTSEWVFALASSPTTRRTYQIRARPNGRTANGWLKGGGIVDVMIDSVPTGGLMVIPNKKTAKEDVVGGSTYLIEMVVTSDGLAPATVDTQVSVDGLPLVAS
ncbi:MAG: hypothetical protein ACLQUY_01335 [Ktedonobacterales bacterium]